MMENILYHPGFVFALCFICTYLIYAFGKAMAPIGQPAEGKEKTYACGEDVDANIAPSYNWFHIAFVFTLLDIGVLMVATMPAGVGLPLAIAWLVGGAAAVLMMLND